MSAVPTLERAVLRREMPDHLFELPLFATLAKCCFLIGVALVLYQVLLSLAGSIVSMAACGVAIGVVLFADAAIGHESGHLTASRSRFVNDFIGVVTMSLVGMPSRGWKVYHDIHHRHTGVLGIDTDAQYTVAQYVCMTPARRRAMRWVCEHEFMFWPLGALIIAGICWSYSLQIATGGGMYTRRIRIWNAADMAMSIAVVAAVIAFGIVNGPQLFFFGVVLPYLVGGVMGACTFTTNHRNLPPLTREQAARVRNYFHLNTRTLTFPRWLPGNYFTGYVPWQIEHHMFPTVAGRRLKEVSPWVRKHAAERNVALEYTDYVRASIAVSRTRFAWGADGRLHSFADIDRRLAEGVEPAQMPGYEIETSAVPRRDLRDVFGLR